MHCQGTGPTRHVWWCDVLQEIFGGTSLSELPSRRLQHNVIALPLRCFRSRPTWRIPTGPVKAIPMSDVPPGPLLTQGHEMQVGQKRAAALSKHRQGGLAAAIESSAIAGCTPPSLVASAEFHSQARKGSNCIPETSYMFCELAWNEEEASAAF